MQLSVNKSRPRFNPLLKVILALGGILGITMIASIIEFLYVAGIFITLCLIINVRMGHILRSIRAVISWTMFFFIIHILFTFYSQADNRLLHILFDESIVLLRFIGLAGVMGVVREGVNIQALVDSIKTVVDRLRVLQTLRLIMLFIPHVIGEYRSLERFNSALGFMAPSSLVEKVRFYGGNLAPVMSRSLARAYQIGAVMNVRGYGRVIPRGQLTPVSVTLVDIGLATVSLLLLTSVLWIF
jgi:energy-coupling factor transporter transmembrane protein EcfT